MVSPEWCMLCAWVLSNGCSPRTSLLLHFWTESSSSICWCYKGITSTEIWTARWRLIVVSLRKKLVVFILYFWPCAPGNPHCAPSNVQARTCSRCQRPSLEMCFTTLGSQWKCCRQWANQYHRSACLIHAHPPSQPRRKLPACHCLSF